MSLVNILDLKLKKKHACLNNSILKLLMQYLDFLQTVMSKLRNLLTNVFLILCVDNLKLFTLQTHHPRL